MLHERLLLALRGRATVVMQAPLTTSDQSVPEPDVFVTSLGSYWVERPTRAFLVAEVADSSLAYDRGEKATMYALADIDEYWIVDLVHECIEVRRDRRDGEWHSLTTHQRGERIAMLAFADVTIDVADVLPPVSG